MISLIVVNRNGASAFAGEQIPDVHRHLQGRNMLEACLAGLVDVPDTELIVVDNGSTDGSRALVRSLGPKAKLIENADNRGFAPAVCQAVAVAQGRFLLLVNSDVILDASRIGTLAGEMEARPKLGVLTCRTEYPGGNLQRPASRFLTPGGMLLQLLGLRTPHDDAFDAGRYGEPDWVAGGVMLIRREAWDAVGGMDAGFVFYEEDADFCLRLRKAGWGVGYTPEVTAMHVRAATAEREAAFAFEQRWRSLLRYVGKHYSCGWRLLIKPVVMGRLVLRGGLAAARGGESGIAGAAFRVVLLKGTVVMKLCPFKMGDRVTFQPDGRTIGWCGESFDRLRIHPGDSGIITKIESGAYLYLDDDRGGFHWECFRKCPTLGQRFRSFGAKLFTRKKY